MALNCGCTQQTLKELLKLTDDSQCPNCGCVVSLHRAEGGAPPPAANVPVAGVVIEQAQGGNAPPPPSPARRAGPAIRAEDCNCTQESLIQLMKLEATAACPKCGNPVYDHEVAAAKSANANRAPAAAQQEQPPSALQRLGQAFEQQVAVVRGIATEVTRPRTTADHIADAVRTTLRQHLQVVQQFVVGFSAAYGNQYHLPGAFLTGWDAARTFETNACKRGVKASVTMDGRINCFVQAVAGIDTYCAFNVFAPPGSKSILDEDPATLTYEVKGKTGAVFSNANGMLQVGRPTPAPVGPNVVQQAKNIVEGIRFRVFDQGGKVVDAGIFHNGQLINGLRFKDDVKADRVKNGAAIGEYTGGKTVDTGCAMM